MRVISLDIDEGHVVAAELVKSGRQISLVRSATAASLEEVAGAFLKNEAALVINLPTQAVLFRTFHLSSSFLKSKNKEKDILSFLLHQNLPFKLEECLWDCFAWDSTLIFIAAKKEVVSKYVSQVEGLKSQVYSMTASQVALYNVFIHNYPEERERFVLLNIRSASSDLLFYEEKRVTIYPIALGKRDLKEEADKREDRKEKFAAQIQQIFNSHYMQYPMAAGKTTDNRLYVSGQDASYGLIFALKKALGDFDVKVMEPLRNINSAQAGAVENQEALALACGLGLGYLEAENCININLLKAKLKEREKALRGNFLKSAAGIGTVALLIALVIIYRGIFKDFERYAFMYNSTEFQVSSQLPKVKNIKEQKELLQKYRDYLESRLEQEKLNYLKAVAAIAESKPYSLAISNLVVQVKEPKDSKIKDAALQEAQASAKAKEFVFKPTDLTLQVFVSGTGPDYEDINAFLANLKKTKDVRDARIIASTFPTLESKATTIDFKVGFDIVSRATKAPRQQAGPATLKKVTAAN